MVVLTSSIRSQNASFFYLKGTTPHKTGFNEEGEGNAKNFRNIETQLSIIQLVILFKKKKKNEWQV